MVCRQVQRIEQGELELSGCRSGWVVGHKQNILALISWVRKCVSCYLQDAPQQSFHRPHLLNIPLWVYLARPNRVVGQLLLVSEPTWPSALLNGLEQVMDIDVDRLKCLPIYICP